MYNMKIKNLKINGFGKLKNIDINLENGINVIYGENEAGKSTLLKYITSMFYGLTKNKNGGSIPENEKYFNTHPPSTGTTGRRGDVLILTAF